MSKPEFLRSIPVLGTHCVTLLLRKLYNTMLAASAILQPICNVSIDYKKDDTSVSSTARTVKASNHDPQLLAQRKKVRTEDTFSTLTFRCCILKIFRFKIAVS